MKTLHLLCISALTGLLCSCEPVVIAPPVVTAPVVKVGHIRVLPTGYKTIHASGTRYYTHGGKYWKYRNGAYIRVARPGALVVTPSGVRVLPRGHKVVRIRGKKYYKWGGRHHVWHPRRGYIVVRP